MERIGVSQATSNVPVTAETIEARKAKFRKWASIGGIGAVVLVATPVVFVAAVAVTTAAVAAGAAVVAGVGLAVGVPWFTKKAANWKYRALEAERINHMQKVQAQAAENPIESFRGVLQQKDAAFTNLKGKVEKAIAAREMFKKRCDDFAKRFPEKAQAYYTQLENLNHAVEAKKVALRDAQDKLELGHHKLEEMVACWEMSKDLQAANEAADIDMGDLYAKLKEDTASDAVIASMNMAFAQLEVAAALRVDEVEADAAGPALRISAKPPQPLDLPTIEEPVHAAENHRSGVGTADRDGVVRRVR